MAEYTLINCPIFWDHLSVWFDCCRLRHNVKAKRFSRDPLRQFTKPKQDLVFSLLKLQALLKSEDWCDPEFDDSGAPLVNGKPLPAPPGYRWNGSQLRKFEAPQSADQGR